MTLCILIQVSHERTTGKLQTRWSIYFMSLVILITTILKLFSLNSTRMSPAPWITLPSNRKCTLKIKGVFIDKWAGRRRLKGNPETGKKGNRNCGQNNKLTSKTRVSRVRTTVWHELGAEQYFTSNKQKNPQ